MGEKKNWFSWEFLFPPAILKRGRAYFEDGCVDAIWQEGSTIEAEVTGSEVYRVSLQVHDDCLEAWSCTCPYAADGTPCKHLAAVCYALEKDSPVLEDAEPSLAELVDSLSPAKLRALVLELAQKDRQLSDRLRLLAGPLTAKDRKKWETKLEHILRQAGGQEKFIPYDQAWETVQQYQELLSQAAEQFLAAGLPWEAFALTGYGFKAIARYEMDDSDGEWMELGKLCLSLWEEQITAASPEEREAMYHWFDQNNQTLPLEFEQDILWQAQVSLFRERNFLQKTLARTDDLMAQAQASSQQMLLPELALIRLDLMEELGASPEETEHFAKDFQNLHQIRQRKVEKLLEADRWQEAEDLLQKSKTLDQKYPGLVNGYSRQLIALYQEHHQEEEFQAELRFQVFQCRQDNLTYLQLLKREVSPETWPEVREELLAQESVSYVQKKFLASEGLYDRLLEQVVSGGFLEELDDWAPELRKHFPEQVRQAYETMLQKEMGMASNRKQYTILIAHLRRLGLDADGKARAAALADHWRQAYPRRKSMLEELEKAGY